MAFLWAERRTPTRRAMKRVPDPAPYRRSSHWTVKGSPLGGPTAWAVGTIPCRQASRQTLRTETGGLQDVRPDSGTICRLIGEVAVRKAWHSSPGRTTRKALNGRCGGGWHELGPTNAPASGDPSGRFHCFPTGSPEPLSRSNIGGHAHIPSQSAPWLRNFSPELSSMPL